MTRHSDVIVQRTPGKLFIAGEYAVVSPGEPSVLVAVDRYVTVELQESRERGTIRSAQYGRLPLVWTREDDRVVIDPDHSPSDYAFAAITVVEQLVAERGVQPRFYDIDIQSELDDVSGRKFGLGSSAAVTVATVRALDAFYGLGLSDVQVFKTALVATVMISGDASGGDVAACTFGGWIAYSAPDRASLRDPARPDSIQAAVDRDWPGFSVRHLPAPAGLTLLVGWTGQPASTTRLVGSVQHRTRAAGTHYGDFLDRSRACVTALVDALDAHDRDGIMGAVRGARAALGDLAGRVGLQIETPTLAALCDTAVELGAVAKSSGAGGGDCGIVLAPQDADVHRLLREWEQYDIRHLDIKVHDAGGTRDEQ